MNFALTPELQALQARVRGFIADDIIPLERDPRWGECHEHTADRDDRQDGGCSLTTGSKQ